MRQVTFLTLCTLLTGISLGLHAAEREKPIAWVYVRGEKITLLAKPGDQKAKRGELARGSLVELLSEKSKGTAAWDRIRSVNPQTLHKEIGWVRASLLNRIPYDEFPSDSELLSQVGGPFLDDFVAAHTVMARFLLSEGSESPLLVCYIGSRILPDVRLQVFRRSGAKFVPGPSLKFPFTDIGTLLQNLEVRDLLRDHEECLVSTETSSSGPENSLSRIVIRIVEGNSFKTLWQAPLKLKNLASYPAKPEVLEPPEKNIGQPGTVTTGKVTFESTGKTLEPVWQGKVEFFVVGRKQPVETVPIKKACPWTGAGFTPLQ